MQSRRPLVHQALSTRRFSKSESNPRSRARATLTATERRLAAEKECEQLLIERYEDYVRNGRKREERPLKDKIRTELTELIPNLSRRSFDKCWKGTAVAQCWDWTLPGQR
jgi:hypothetical protein